MDEINEIFQDDADAENAASEHLCGFCNLSDIVAPQCLRRQEAPSMDLFADIAFSEDEELETLMGNTIDKVRLQVGMDSGSVANVIQPEDLPEGVEVTKSTSDKHFRGAGDGKIKRHGSCQTMMNGDNGKFCTDWQVAGVTRALHSVSKVTGPEDHPTGLQDVVLDTVSSTTSTVM